ncbi:hypothetical protein JYT84_00590 [bacterium AH-315-M10]|nr:hypothetical protein [bacterium AH-315-M10]MBN4054980.1 hypothetical protein [Acidimicrobium ferrooxidans]
MRLKEAFSQAAAAEREAWTIVVGLRESGGASSWIWPVGKAVDDAWVRYCSAGAAKDCVSPDPDEVSLSIVPDSAASVRAWAQALTEIQERRRDYEGEQRDQVLQVWERIKHEEESRQATILRELVLARIGQGDSSAGNDTSVE